MAHKSIFGYLEDSAASDKLKVKRSMSRYEEWTEAILPADAEAEGPEGETSRRPLLAFGVVAGVALSILLLRLFSLQVVAGDENLALANGNRIRERVERAPRGMIYDRNKVVLARNQASFDVTAVPQLLPTDEKERRKEYERVASMLGLPVDEVAKRAEVTCKVKTPGCLRSPIPQLIAAGVDRDKALLIDQSSGSLPGFALDVNPIRQYADENLLSVFLGYTGRVSPEEVKSNPTYGPTDLIGKLGLEKQYEEVLRGTNGGERTEVDATGRPVRVLASRDPAPGDNLVLSIDQSLQRKMSEALRTQMTRGNIKRGAGIAVNPKTGEVLAAVSLPTYDNNEFSRGIGEASYRALVNDPGQPLFNKVLSGAYPSGSVIKPMTASAALQEKIVTANTIINDTGQLDVVNPYDNSIHYIYKGWETSGLGNVNLFSAIARSSDIYFYTIAGGFTNFTRYLGVEKLTDWYMKFGFGARTGVDLPSETKGRVPTPEWKKKFSGDPWYTGDTYNISVGQGDILTSPIQMAMATAAVANGGKLLKPHFVSEVTDANGKTVKKYGAETIRQVPVSPENLALVRQGMRDTIQKPYGTACCFMEKEVPVPVAGKTGSAETDPNNKVLPHSWFTSFSPYNDPKIVTVVLFEKAGEGSQFAAPATRELLRWYYTEGAGASR
ncbi:MAG: penicillin-binding protein 2, penicillin-binding protein 2 [Candidatus Saccharibacteria bacterium]|jgi:penicillin-binding protein 2|nr:penicillin-binding protein 2, penicillin-binding protein 2 [Candidatus Saccharibacteria bacterium]